jgi:hypothetical protein
MTFKKLKVVLVPIAAVFGIVVFIFLLMRARTNQKAQATGKFPENISYFEAVGRELKFLFQV